MARRSRSPMHMKITCPDRLGTSLPFLLGSLTLAWTLGACRAPCPHDDGTETTPTQAKEEQEKKEKEKKDDDHAMERAELKLESARLESESSIAKARDDVRDAEYALEDARIELASFLGHEYPMELAEQTLALQKAQNELRARRRPRRHPADLRQGGKHAARTRSSGATRRQCASRRRSSRSNHAARISRWTRASRRARASCGGRWRKPVRSSTARAAPRGPKRVEHRRQGGGARPRRRAREVLRRRR